LLEAEQRATLEVQEEQPPPLIDCDAEGLTEPLPRLVHDEIVDNGGPRSGGMAMEQHGVIQVISAPCALQRSSQRLNGRGEQCPGLVSSKPSASSPVDCCP